MFDGLLSTFFVLTWHSFDGGAFGYSYTGDLTNWFHLDEFLLGEYKNYKRVPMPDRNTLFEETDTIEEAFFDIKANYSLLLIL